MRGKGEVKHFTDFTNRITPAHAGKSKFTHSKNSPFKDHPRTCGEKFNIEMSFTDIQGSPPHMRGKVRFV